jgi:hypothetical protein
MSNEKSFPKQNFKSDELDRDLYTAPQIKERALNAAIVDADIEEGYEKYLAIFDAFYGDEVEVSSETAGQPIRGKDRVRSLLGNLLYPVHVMAEIGGLTVTIRVAEIAGDVAGETHSAWTAEFVGISGRTNTVSWRVFRKWNGARVVYEYHYDQQQKGGPLTSTDLSFNDATPAPPQFGRPS